MPPHIKTQTLAHQNSGCIYRQRKSIGFRAIFENIVGKGVCEEAVVNVHAIKVLREVKTQHQSYT
ncbi:MAG: hypothetical protein J7M24_05165, partial [Candidatus Latescibacteria bacterium]|nr:hypothetical protein [Candidatus Latescibacterota bacterium]